MGSITIRWPQPANGHASKGAVSMVGPIRSHEIMGFSKTKSFPDAQNGTNGILVGGNSNMFYSHPYLGKIPNFDEHIFQRG